MKRTFRLLLPIVYAALIVTFTACEESPIKSDYDYPIDTSKAPKGVVTIDADVYMTKARFAGEVSEYANLVDFGFVYCPDSILNKADGSFEKAVLQGLIPSRNMISMKASVLTNDFDSIFKGLSPNTDYAYATYAVNYNGVTYGDPSLFRTGATYASILDVNGAMDQSVWESKNFYQVDKDGDGRNFEFSIFKLTHKGYISYAKQGPNIYTPDNLFVLPGKTIGIDMNLDFMVYPTGTTAGFCKDKYSILISKDSITLANCDDAAILDSLTFGVYYHQDTILLKDNASLPDSLRFVERSIAIPQEYNHSKVWIAVRHHQNTKQALFIEKLKLY